ncbi:Uncharacterised protein at_DN1107 [Pycnogonum litorale]
MPIPSVVVADDAFPLQIHVMKPYPMRSLSHDERIFNYRLCRSRRVSENAFGIWNSRFRIFNNALRLSPDKVQNVVLAAVCLHNFLTTVGDRQYASKPYLSSEAWRDDVTMICPLAPTTAHNTSLPAKNIREEFKLYFNTSGAVSWQDERCDLSSLEKDR